MRKNGLKSTLTLPTRSARPHLPSPLHPPILKYRTLERPINFSDNFLKNVSKPINNPATTRPEVDNFINYAGTRINNVSNSAMNPPLRKATFSWIIR